MSTFYQQRIATLVQCTPREAVFVEAVMRLCQNGTLDHLSAPHFRAIAEACLLDVRQQPEHLNVALAKSYGLKVLP